MKMNAVQKLLVMVVGCVVLALGAVEAQAVDMYWKDPVSGNFQDETKWTIDPDPAYRARFDEAGEYTVTFTDSATNWIVQFDTPASGTATVTADIGAGQFWRLNGNFMVFDQNHLIVPSGAITNVSSMEVGQQDNASASLSLSNAAVFAQNFKMGLGVDNTSEVRVTDGSTLEVSGFEMGNSTAAGSPSFLVSDSTWIVSFWPKLIHGTVILTNNSTVSFPNAGNGFRMDAVEQCSLTMYDGQFTATKATVATATPGTATVSVVDGTVDISGAWTVSGADAAVLFSGGTATLGSVSLQNQGSFHISGGSVSAGSFALLNTGGSLTISGGEVEHTSANDLASYGTVTVIGTNATITVRDDYMAWNGSTTAFLFSHGGVSPIQIPSHPVWAERTSSSALSLGLNGYMAAITTNAMTLFDCGVARTDDFTTKTDLSIFEAGRQIGDTDNLTYEARLLAAEKVSGGPLALGTTVALSTPVNAGWIDIDNTGMSGTVDIHVLLDYAGASKNQAQLIADMTAAGLTMSETTQGPDTYITIATPAPAWSNPAFAWDLSGFDANVEVDAIHVGGFSALGTVISIR